MSVDEETGIEPVARDGEVDQREADQIALRRARRKVQEEAKARKSDQRAEAAVNGNDIDGQPPEAEPEMFPLGSLPGDPKVTHKNLVKAGYRVSIECSLSRAAVEMSGGLHDFGDQGEALVRWEAGVVHTKPDFKPRDAEGRRKAKGVRLVQELTAVHVADASHMYTLEQVLDILEAHFGVPRTAEKVAEVFGLKADAA